MALKPKTKNTANKLSRVVASKVATTGDVGVDKDCNLRGSLPKSSPLDFATKNTFPLFFVREEALVAVY